MRFLPTVVQAEYRGAFRIHIVFNDNSENTIDFREWLQGPVFEPLKDPAFFAQVSCAEGFVEWPGEIDLAPDAMYEEIRDHGTWVLE